MKYEYVIKVEVSLQIIQKITVKQVLTETSRKKLLERFEMEKKELEIECQQLRFEQRKLLNKLGNKRLDIREKFQREMDHRKEKIVMLDFKMEQVSELVNGSEIIEKEVDALIPIEVGMEWDHALHKKSIIIEDGIVVRIDE